MLHRYPCVLRPLLRSSAGTSPCIPVSGSDPALHSARGTAVEPTSSKKNVSADAMAGAGLIDTPRTIDTAAAPMATARCAIPVRIRTIGMAAPPNRTVWDYLGETNNQYSR